MASWLGVLFGALALAAGASALARSAAPPDPRLQPGAKVMVVEDGFAARAVVTVGLAGERLLGTTEADPHGRIAYRFTVPVGISAGPHALIFAGPAANRTRNRPVGNLVVTAPLVRVWRFRVAGPSGGTSAPASGGHSSHPGGGGGSGASPGHGTRGGGTSSTGADVLLPLAVGLLALVGGGALVLTARRRPPPPADPARPPRFDLTPGACKIE